MLAQNTPESSTAAVVPEQMTPYPATPPRMTFEEKIQIADLFFKVLGATFLIVGGWVSVAKFLDEQTQARTEQQTAREKAALQAEKEQRDRDDRQRAELEHKKKEFKIKFYEQQMALYLAICDAAARIATAEQLEDVKEELRLFNTLYWGKLCIVEGSKAEVAQRKFHDELAKARSAKDRPSTDLVMLCYALAHACRDDLKESFDPAIGSLPAERKGPIVSQELLKQDDGGNSKVKGVK